MRYSFSALVLATIAVTQVAAGPFKHVHRHAHLHDRRNAEPLEVEQAAEKRQDINWATVHITYSSNQQWGSSSAAPVASPVVNNEAAVPASTTPAASGKAAPASSAPASSSPASSGSGGSSKSLTSADASQLASLGMKGTCTNGQSSSTPGGIWIGSDGPYTNEFTNDSGESLILVIWGPSKSWINASPPLVCVSLANGQSTTISFASGNSGAWAAVHGDTILENGQVSNTWGEFTFGPEGVVDVSREVNMNGRTMSIVGPQCTSDMEKCVFICPSGQKSCEFGYSLQNCGAGSQPGAQYGTYGGAASGGCGGLGNSASLKTSLS